MKIVSHDVQAVREGIGISCHIFVNAASIRLTFILNTTALLLLLLHTPYNNNYTVCRVYIMYVPSMMPFF